MPLVPQTGLSILLHAHAAGADEEDAASVVAPASAAAVVDSVSAAVVVVDSHSPALATVTDLVKKKTYITLRWKS